MLGKASLAALHDAVRGRFDVGYCQLIMLHVEKRYVQSPLNFGSMLPRYSGRRLYLVCAFRSAFLNPQCAIKTHWLRFPPSSARPVSSAGPPANTFRHLAALAAAFSLALSFCRADEANLCAVLGLTRSAAAMSARLRPWLCSSSALRSRGGNVDSASFSCSSAKSIAISPWAGSSPGSVHG